MRIAIAGAGLAGLAAAWVLAEEGHEVDVFEARKMVGGRATSYEVPDGNGGLELVDNSQHILMRCCENLLDLYRRLGIDDLVVFHDTFTFIEPGGRRSVLKAGSLPAPLHFAGAFLGLRFLSLRDKLSIARGMAAVRSDIHHGESLDAITMADWLRAHHQTEAALRFFWEPVLVSAVNESLDVISAWQGLRVIHLGFVAGKRNYEMGVPTVPLAELYAPERWERHPRIRIHRASPVKTFEREGDRVLSACVNGERFLADAFISALPYERIGPLFPELGLHIEGFAHSPIAGIHLRFDRRVTHLPHAALLGRTIQWFYSRSEGTILSVVVSVARSLEKMRREDIVDLVLHELAEFEPRVREANCVSSHVIRETRATFVASPGFEAQRPGPVTPFRNFFLAGEWTRTGWPSTMEGAVISGYRAASEICHLDGRHIEFVVEAPAPGIG